MWNVFASLEDVAVDYKSNLQYYSVAVISRNMHNFAIILTLEYFEDSLCYGLVHVRSVFLFYVFNLVSFWLKNSIVVSNITPVSVIRYSMLCLLTVMDDFNF